MVNDQKLITDGHPVTRFLGTLSPRIPSIWKHLIYLLKIVCFLSKPDMSKIWPELNSATVRSVSRIYWTRTFTNVGAVISILSPYHVKVCSPHPKTFSILLYHMTTIWYLSPFSSHSLTISDINVPS